MRWLTLLAVGLPALAADAKGGVARLHLTLRRARRFRPTGPVRWPSISPSGRLAVAVAEGGVDNRLLVIDLQKGRVRRLDVPGLVGATRPLFLDDRRVVLGCCLAGRDCRDPRWQACLVDLDSGKLLARYRAGPPTSLLAGIWQPGATALLVTSGRFPALLDAASGKLLAAGEDRPPQADPTEPEPEPAASCVTGAGHLAEWTRVPRPKGPRWKAVLRTYRIHRERSGTRLELVGFEPLPAASRPLLACGDRFLAVASDRRRVVVLRQETGRPNGKTFACQPGGKLAGFTWLQGDRLLAVACETGSGTRLAVWDVPAGRQGKAVRLPGTLVAWWPNLVGRGRLLLANLTRGLVGLTIR